VLLTTYHAGEQFIASRPAGAFGFAEECNGLKDMHSDLNSHPSRPETPAGRTGIATRSVACVGGSGTRPQSICSELVRLGEQCLGSAAQTTGNSNSSVGDEIAHRTEARRGWRGCRYLSVVSRSADAVHVLASWGSGSV
jgi:hypothetical protein